ncbi:hypothetical protein [Legionella bononiensis]|uniref:Uncharacterized protein n=1 Tax=Legionella bononiensis TaxID=2793102 RepID=A0ABS1W730_9GAMM|nr:hypothetical protein [Legionella bononiensis]MBL7481264.1 hypothetical protein [Legionella bononiensis]MBL7525169.1 hypothetical protein [Legionella bononiensis]MBL7562893.1 hypothetical protein [Legionella bononiensis]
MKPISATCISKYSLSYPGHEDKYYIRFQVVFAENDAHGTLTIETDEYNRNAIQSKLELQNSKTQGEFQPWIKDSWQDALLNAWLRYFNAIGYCAATTKDMVYQLKDQADGTFFYDLCDESKKGVHEMLPHGIVYNDDGTQTDLIVVPQEHADRFIDSENSAASNATDKTNTKQLISTSINSFDCHIISGFIFAIGVAAVALAFTLLHAASGGIAGLVVGGIGITAMLTGGIGLFNFGSAPDHKEIERNLLSVNSPA